MTGERCPASWVPGSQGLLIQMVRCLRRARWALAHDRLADAAFEWAWAMRSQAYLNAAPWTNQISARRHEMAWTLLMNEWDPIQDAIRAASQLPQIEPLGVAPGEKVV